MIHEAKRKLWYIIVCANALTKNTWLNIPLALPCAKEYIPSAAFLYHSFGNLMVLIFISITF